jgi:spectinomycin phosphotransferase
MLEKPDLEDAEIVACLRESYRFAVVAVEFMPLGNDATAWVYRVTAGDGTVYFLKVKRGAVYVPSLVVPRYLKDHGVGQVVAPLQTKAQTLWTPLNQFSLILYPFIDGKVGMEVGLTDSQWAEFGAVLKAIHSVECSDRLFSQLRRETFVPRWSAAVKSLAAKVDDGGFDDPFERELATFWRERSDEINRIVDRTEELGRMLQRMPLRFVLCHADIHTANILLDREGRMFIVDWDDIIVAPKERDLMFVPGADADAGDRQEQPFFGGYGHVEVDPLALAYYRYEWVVQEIGDFGERVYAMPHLGAATKADSVAGFRQLFDPGDVVEAAYNSD